MVKGRRSSPKSFTKHTYDIEETAVQNIYLSLEVEALS